ncbi:P-loop containing nucleoside triphosphate hydrolase protein, partial [Baffinella frigidus]
PSRPDAVVLKDFSLVIEAGETVALVGQSGSGKSTIIGLLERFYDLISGEVLVDGVAVKDWNLRALRSQIGLVQQESVTFGVSILENIMMGDDSYDPDAEPKVLAEFEARAIECSKMANSHVFISKLPDGYRTLAGTSVSNTRLSGGQMQRVCIARQPPNRNHTATSALDTESERIVQASLDVLLSKGGGGIQCTTIMIAHRLSTVTAADKIVVLDRGVIVEMGSHSQLMAKVDGLYKAMRQVHTLNPQRETLLKNSLAACFWYKPGTHPENQREPHAHL